MNTNPPYCQRRGYEPKDIKNAHEEGFKMVKVTLPRRPYDVPSFFPLWEMARN